jgi:hypothetical protein
MSIRAHELQELLEWAYVKGGGQSEDSKETYNTLLKAYNEVHAYVTSLEDQMDKMGKKHDITFAYDKPPKKQRFKQW